MGNHVDIEAKPGCAEQINVLWEKAFPDEDPLVLTKAILQREVDRIQNGENKHLRHLQSTVRTVEDWKRVFSTMAEGHGQVFISATGAEIPEDEANKLRRQVQFVLDHWFLFQRITGLQDAREELGMDIEGDEIQDGQTIRHKPLTFTDLPVEPKNDLYMRCLEHDRPDLWEAYVGFRDEPSWESWQALRSKIVPWPAAPGLLGDTVWRICEAQATARDGKATDCYGRFRDGEHPSPFEVERALRAVAPERVEKPDDESPGPGM